LQIAAGTGRPVTIVGLGDKAVAESREAGALGGSSASGLALPGEAHHRQPRASRHGRKRAATYDLPIRAGP